MVGIVLIQQNYGIKHIPENGCPGDWKISAPESDELRFGTVRFDLEKKRRRK